MRNSTLLAVALLVGSSVAASADTFTFNTDPFAGSNATTTPGRQVVGGEPTINFVPGTDALTFDTSAFAPYGFSAPLVFANDFVGNLPATGANFIVLQTLDNDANGATPFGAGTAANLIAAQVTSPGAGFFIYFNSALNLPRLVFSTDLSDNTADLKILARFTNLTGDTASLGDVTADSVSAVPEPSALALVTSAAAMWGVVFTRRQRRA